MSNVAITRLRICLLIVLGVTCCVAVGLILVCVLPLSEPPRSHLLAPVTNVHARSGRGEVTVTWDEVRDAASYQVLKSEHADRDFWTAGSPFGTLGLRRFPLIRDRLSGRFALSWYLGRVTKPAFADTDVIPGHTYYYRVRATDGLGWTTSEHSSSEGTKYLEAGDNTIQINVDAASDNGVLEHTWELALGSDHLLYLSRGNENPNLPNAGLRFKEALKIAHTQLGTQYVIAHGILSDDQRTYTEDAKGNQRNDWSYVDNTYDTILQLGMKPFVQLDFMPQALASKPRATMIAPFQSNASPPKDYRKWSKLIAALAEHLIHRYGRVEIESWRFEVWNEPEICSPYNGCYWTGTRDDYYKLYVDAAIALKTVDPALRVGGPVTFMTRYVEQFLNYVAFASRNQWNSKALIDFLDVRVYDAAAEDWRPLLKRTGFEGLPVFYTEWGIHRRNGPMHDMPYAAAWIVHGVHESDGLVKGLSYWNVSDYFEERKDPKQLFHGGFGLLGIDEIRKPAFWGYYLLHQLGDRKIYLRGTGDGFGTLVTGWATKGDDSVRILLSNVSTDENEAGGNPKLRRDVSLRIRGLSCGARVVVEHWRVDEGHSNVLALWKKMGEPRWPTASQLAELHRGDSLQAFEEPRETSVDSRGEVVLKFNLPMPSVSFIVVRTFYKLAQSAN